MSAKPLQAWLSVRLGPLKPLWNEHCRKRGVNPSEELRQLISKELAAPQMIASKPVSRIDAADRKRLIIYLGEQEWSYAHDLSRIEGYRSLNRFASACVRHRISKGAQLGQSEIDSLADSNYQLAAIGRNLNQLTRDVHRFGEGIAEHRYQVLQNLTTAVKSHMEQVRKLLKANYDRWN